MIPSLRTTGAKLRYAHASEKRSLSNRLRNSVFSGAFLQGLRIGFDADRSTWTLGGQIAHGAREGKDDPNDLANKATPPYNTDLELNTSFIDVLFTELVDRNVQAPPAARRISTSTIQAPAAPPGQSPTMSREIIDLAVESIEKELSWVSSYSTKDAGLGSALGQYQYLLDNGNSDEKLFGKSIADQMRALKWRLKIQENFFLALEGLTNEGLVDPDVLLNPNKPITWKFWPEWLFTLISLLRCFSLADECGS